MSAAHWFIHKNGQTLGPISAAEIREGLRDGTYDPFDLVSRDNSAVRREIVEVDEIFADGEPGGSGGADDVPVVEMEEVASRNGPIAGKGALLLASSDTQPEANGGGSEPPPRRSKDSSPRNRRKNPRHFHVEDINGRILGPLSAVEIRSLFYKGVLDKRVKVMRDGARARVAVGRFVAVYSEVKRSRVEQSSHPAVGGPLSGRNRMPPIQRARPVNLSPVVIALVAAGVLVIALAAWISFTKSGRGWMARKGSSPRSGQEMGRDESDRRIAPKRPAGSGRLPVPDDARRFETVPNKRALLPPARAPRASVPPAGQRSLSPNVRPSLNPRATAPKPWTPPKVPGPTQPPKPPPKVAPKLPPLTAGQVVTRYGPLSFDKASLAACSASCVLTFMGPNGPVKVAFFKKIWAPTLMSKSGAVFVSGFVSGSGAERRIMLSGVQ